MLTFAHSWLFLLLPIPLLVRWFVPAITKSRPAIRVPFMARLKESNANEIVPDRRLQRTLLISGLIWILIVIALARPQWLESPIERTIPTRDLLLLVDLSGSMQHEDFTNKTGEPVDRLTALKEVLGDFLVRRQGDRVALVVFGNSPFLQVPFSTDLELSRQLLQETSVGMAGPRTSFGDAIGQGIQLFDNSDAPAKTMIALTDGNDNASAVPPIEAARVAADREITIHAIAMGDPTTVGEEKIDEEELKGVANVTGGQMFLALNQNELMGVYDRLDEIETRDVQTVSHRPRRDLYFWFVAAALFLSLADSVLRLARNGAFKPAKKSAARLRVNTRTFELETVEQ